MLIIDASITACWLLDDESNKYAESIIDRLETDKAISPLIWKYEIRNLLISAVRRKRIAEDTILPRLETIDLLPLDIDHTPNLDETARLAIKHELSFYDALYLELTKRKNGKLITLDKKLQRAFESESTSKT